MARENSLVHGGIALALVEPGIKEHYRG
jgi:hypothetical protein